MLVGILVNNSGLSDLKFYMDSRFAAVDQRFEAERRVNDTMVKMVLDKLDIHNRLSRLESRFAR